MIKVWAHRGASGYAPENTLPSFKKAVEMRADGVELDIQLTKDGEIVVTHDEKIDRVADHKGWVKDYTLSELKKMDFAVTNKNFEFVTIPTLKEVYELLKPTGLTVNVEIKTGIVFYKDIEKKAIELTESMGMRDRVIYSSFNHYTLQKIKAIDPIIKTGMLYADGIIDAPKYGKKTVGVDAMHPALYNIQYPGYFEECKKLGLDINVWTVNEEEYMQMLCKMGADAMITNYPDVARRIVDQA
ncbi:MAG: glycerophosphodiester phosphodiesterase [Lachnospiraceae bacterium]|jgi:glycerophosphoryl diester phosphodiesterase|nr:glycerophosphodiester phosphodiesterase [Lachnospiraceae bacterium]